VYEKIFVPKNSGVKIPCLTPEKFPEGHLTPELVSVGRWAELNNRDTFNKKQRHYPVGQKVTLLSTTSITQYNAT